jgi:hypothetical protein
MPTRYYLTPLYTCDILALNSNPTAVDAEPSVPKAFTSVIPIQFHPPIIHRIDFRQLYLSSVRFLLLVRLSY